MSERGVMGQVAGTRVRVLSDRPVQALGSYVLYWMTATRRTRRPGDDATPPARCSRSPPL
jgi:hypothetical protein